MKYQEAKKQFEHVLNNQSTVSTKKLSRLMQNMHISLESSDNKEINYLKNEIKKRDIKLNKYHVVKYKGKTPTVIKIGGRRYVYDPNN